MKFQVEKHVAINQKDYGIKLIKKEIRKRKKEKVYGSYFQIKFIIKSFNNINFNIGLIQLLRMYIFLCINSYKIPKMYSYFSDYLKFNL